MCYNYDGDNMKNRILLISIASILFTFLLFSFSTTYKELSAKNLATDSGFDSNNDSSSSSSSFEGSAGSSNGTIMDLDIFIYKLFFPNGFTFKDYCSFFGSFEYFLLLGNALFLNIAFDNYLRKSEILEELSTKQKKIVKIYGFITYPILFVFPNVLTFLIKCIADIIYSFKSFRKSIKECEKKEKENKEE